MRRLLLVGLLAGCRADSDVVTERLAEKGYALSMEEFGRAATEGDDETLDLFTRAGVRPDGRDREGLRAFDRAVLAGQDDAAAWLWDHGGVGEDLKPAVWKAAVASGSVATVRLLEERAEPPVSVALLLPAVQSRNLDVLELVIGWGTKIDAGAALRLSAKLGRLDMSSMLLDADTDPNGADPSSGRTALMEAAASGHLDLINLLLERGAEPQTTDREGRTAAWLAEAAGHMDAGKRLSVAQ